MRNQPRWAADSGNIRRAGTAGRSTAFTKLNRFTPSVGEEVDTILCA